MRYQRKKGLLKGMRNLRLNSIKVEVIVLKFKFSGGHATLTFQFYLTWR